MGEHPGPFNSAMALAKATARARRGLPQTPRRRKAVCRKLSMEWEGDNSADRASSSRSTALNNETAMLVEQFYQHDDVSRQAPGRKDAMTIRQKDGTKLRCDDGTLFKKQTRHLTASLGETHALFREEYPAAKIGKSKFAELRPQHVFLCSKLPDNVCTSITQLCTTCWGGCV